ncbi:MAG: sporulation initiation factor Spo0A C-terminal domain-containing protein [Lachnospiraceae bacterium]
MNRELSVLLIEADPSERQRLVECIGSSENITLTAATARTEEGLELLKERIPHVIVLDLELHHGSGNGISFLQNLKSLALDVSPYILITTSNTSTVTHNQAREYGADFIFSKHQADYSAEAVVSFLLTISDTIIKKFAQNTTAKSTPESPAREKQRLRNRIQAELNLIGINPRSVGFKYLTDAILCVLDGMDRNYCIAVGEKYNRNETSIERSMQRAINDAWRTNDIKILSKHYTARLSEYRGAPSPMEFVHYYANLIKTDYI